MSKTTRCRPCSEPGCADVMPVPMMIEGDCYSFSCCLISVLPERLLPVKSRSPRSPPTVAHPMTDCGAGKNRRRKRRGFPLDDCRGLCVADGEVGAGSHPSVRREDAADEFHALGVLGHQLASWFVGGGGGGGHHGPRSALECSNFLHVFQQCGLGELRLYFNNSIDPF